jgi:hypothetical protein
MNPALAIANSTVVEVHQGSNGVGPLWYRVGTITTFPLTTYQVIAWSDSHQYDNGAFPAVAVNGTRVVEAHEGGNGRLWYRTGQIQSTSGGLTIAWNNSIQYGNGFHPAVFLLSDADASTTTVAEVHQTADGVVGALVYRGGTVHDYYSVPDGGYIAWAAPTNHNYTCGVGSNGQYDIGTKPAVAITGWDDPSTVSEPFTLAEYHQETDGVGWLVLDLGPIWSVKDGGRMDGPCSLDNQTTIGVHPSIAVMPAFSCSFVLVEVHQGQTGVGPLWYSATYITTCTL